MKKSVLILGMLAIMSGFGLSSCAPDYETEFQKDYLEVPYRNRATVTFGVDGGKHTVLVNTNLPKEKWNAESNSSWCTVRKEEGKVIVSAGTNDNFKTRIAQLSIYYGHQKYDIAVRQLGKASALEIIEENGFKRNKRGATTKDIDATLTELVVPLHTNLKVDHVLIPDTANWVSQDMTASQEGEGAGDFQFGRKKLVLKVEKNTNLTERYCTIILQSSDRWDATTELIIRQSARGNIVEVVEGETQSEYEIEDLGGYINVPFYRNGNAESFEVTIPSEANWIKRVAKTRTFTKDTLRFYVEPNEKTEARSTVVNIKSKNDSEVSEISFTVKQKAFVPVTPNNVVGLAATPGAGSVTLNWQLPEKVNYSKVVVTFEDQGGKNTITRRVNDKTATSITIDKVYKSLGAYTFKVYTEGPTGLKSTESEISATPEAWYEKSNVKVNLAADMIKANATKPGDGGGIPALVDNKVNTYYHSWWGQNPPVTVPHHLEFTLPTPISRSFTFDYKGRNDGDGNGDIKKAKVFVSADGKVWKLLGELTYNLPNARGKHVHANEFVTADAKVKFIKFQPTERRNKVLPEVTANQDFFNLSEIELYEIHDDEWAVANGRFNQE